MHIYLNLAPLAWSVRRLHHTIRWQQLFQSTRTLRTRARLKRGLIIHTHMLMQPENEIIQCNVSGLICGNEWRKFYWAPTAKIIIRFLLDVAAMEAIRVWTGKKSLSEGNCFVLLLLTLPLRIMVGFFVGGANACKRARECLWVCNREHAENRNISFSWTTLWQGHTRVLRHPVRHCRRASCIIVNFQGFFILFRHINKSLKLHCNKNVSWMFKHFLYTPITFNRGSYKF